MSSSCLGKLGVQVYGWLRNEKFLETVHTQYRVGEPSSRGLDAFALKKLI